jgi:hypothetical protein
MNCRDAFNVTRKMAGDHAGGKLAIILNGMSLGFKITQAELIAHDVTVRVFQIASTNFAYKASLDDRVASPISTRNK